VAGQRIGSVRRRRKSLAPQILSGATALALITSRLAVDAPPWLEGLN